MAFTMYECDVAAQGLEQALYNKALILLSRRDYSRFELAKKLAPFSNGEQNFVETILARLELQNYIDDGRYADICARSYLAKGQGPVKVKQSLKQKGLADSIIRHAIESNSKGEFATEILIRRVWNKKFGTAPSDDREKAKQSRFLAARGFSFDQIISLFEKLRHS